MCGTCPGTVATSAHCSVAADDRWNTFLRERSEGSPEGSAWPTSAGLHRATSASSGWLSLLCFIVAAPLSIASGGEQGDMNDEVSTPRGSWGGVPSLSHAPLCVPRVSDSLVISAMSSQCRTPSTGDGAERSSYETVDPTETVLLYPWCPTPKPTSLPIWDGRSSADSPVAEAMAGPPTPPPPAPLPGEPRRPVLLPPLLNRRPAGSPNMPIPVKLKLTLPLALPLTSPLFAAETELLYVPPLEGLWQSARGPLPCPPS